MAFRWPTGFSNDGNDSTTKFTGGGNAPSEPKVLKRQPKRASEQTVTQVTTTGGNKIDVCANEGCKHITTKLITNQTTCDCCRQGHPAGGPK